MELFISSESYAPIGSEFYKNNNSHLVFKAIKSVLAKFKNKEYGQEFVDIGIIPVIMPESMHDAYKERILLKRKKCSADIRLYIDYDKYVNADLDKRILLFWQNIIKSILTVNARKERDFDGDRLVKDLLSEIGMTLEEINAV